MAQTVKNLPAMQETWVQSLGWEDPLEKEMAIYPVFLPKTSHGWEEHGGIQSTGSQRIRQDSATKMSYES